MYRRLKAEILADHAENNYMQAYQMPLTDKLRLSKDRQTEYKKFAQQLTDDPNFPYTVICWIQGNVLKRGYQPHK